MIDDSPLPPAMPASEMAAHLRERRNYTDVQRKSLTTLGKRHAPLTIIVRPNGDLHVSSTRAPRAWIMSTDGRCVSTSYS